MAKHDSPTDTFVPQAPANNSLAAPRLRTIDRSLPSGQTLEDLVPPDHEVRKVFSLVEEMIDVKPLEGKIKAVEGVPGRNATPPILLVALWVYATMDKVTEAHELARRCVEHDPYRWMCGGISLNYHLLSDFRVQQGEWLTSQISRVVEAMLEEDLIDFAEPVGQDGMRTRAHAGSGSFRSKERLEELAKANTDEAESLTTDTKALSKAQASARKRAVKERGERIAKAQEEILEVAASKEQRKKGDGLNARASTTDPQARKMKMGDGGTRPGYNVQFATLLGSLVILGVSVTNIGSDCAQATPMMQQIQDTYGQTPKEAYMDGNYSTSQNIEGLAELGITLYSPVKQPKKDLAKGIDPYAPKRRDTPLMKDWRGRMGTDEAKQKYKQRSKCELPNAWCRNRGLSQFVVRGLKRVTEQAKWYVLAYNLERLMSLRRAKAPEPGC
jgi:transposase